MGHFPATPGIDLSSLVLPDRVSRRVYTDPAVFQMEMERIFHRAWIYVAHESQLRNPGDYVTARIGQREVIVSRHTDGAIHVMHNRCTHRGAMVCRERKGNTRLFRCPYHAWAFRTDGGLQAIPHRGGYDDFDMTDPKWRLLPVPRVDSYRGFVFASLANDGPSLLEHLHGMTFVIDNMVDRSPEGELELAGGAFRQEYRGNWKLHFENATDLIHPGTVHESSVAAVAGEDEAVSREQGLQMYAANGISLSEWDKVGLYAEPGGHVYMEGFYKLPLIAARRQDPVFARYHDALVARHGAEKAEAILDKDHFNNLIYPNVSINFRFQQLRQVIPIAVDRTIVQSQCFRMKGAPEEFFQMAVKFLQTANSPASLISADDLEIFERCQAGFADPDVEWIDFRRGLGTDVVEESGRIRAASGTSELPMRTQYAAWLRYMNGEI